MRGILRGDCGVALSVVVVEEKLRLFWSGVVVRGRRELLGEKEGVESEEKEGVRERGYLRGTDALTLENTHPLSTFICEGEGMKEYDKH